VRMQIADLKLQRSHRVGQSKADSPTHSTACHTISLRARHLDYQWASHKLLSVQSNSLNLIDCIFAKWNIIIRKTYQRHCFALPELHIGDTLQATSLWVDYDAHIPHLAHTREEVLQVTRSRISWQLKINVS
jgi:hypothetical protein